ncbi:MAG: YraN family protein [Mailhella sp.]|nr:YraN family protein [Mailhella sp.]
MLTRKKLLGNEGEQLAAEYLQKQGLRIIERNWRNVRDEIDLICVEKGQFSAETIVFVEVKTRSSDDLLAAASALDRRKQNALVRAASRYLGLHGAWEKPCRFDLICINGAGRSIEHIKDVIHVGDLSFGGNASWQPW